MQNEQWQAMTDQTQILVYNIHGNVNDVASDLLFSYIWPLPEVLSPINL